MDSTNTRNQQKRPISEALRTIYYIQHHNCGSKSDSQLPELAMTSLGSKLKMVIV